MMKSNWVRWTVGIVWVATALAVVTAALLHPRTVANISLTVRQISFWTNTPHLLDATDENTILMSGLQRVEIDSAGTAVISAENYRSDLSAPFELTGEPTISCNFYNVRVDGTTLLEPSLVTLTWSHNQSIDTLTIQSHGRLAGSLTSQARSSEQSQAISCPRASINGEKQTNVIVQLSDQGGDTVKYWTTSDAQLNFRSSGASAFSDSQIPITHQMRVSQIRPGPILEEKSVLLKPASGNRNEVLFEDTGQNIPLDSNDLLIVDPGEDFYLRQFIVGEGIHLTMHGSVIDVRRGAGSTDLASIMPSLFDHLDARKRLYGAIPAISTLILGVLKKMKLLDTASKGGKPDAKKV